MNFYERLEKLLKEKKITRTQLCADTEISYNTLTSMIQRRSTSIDIETIKKIAKYLDTTLEYLISGNKQLKEVQPQIAEFMHFRTKFKDCIVVYDHSGDIRKYDFKMENIEQIYNVCEALTEISKR